MHLHLIQIKYLNYIPKAQDQAVTFLVSIKIMVTDLKISFSTRPGTKSDS